MLCEQGESEDGRCGKWWWGGNSECPHATDLIDASRTPSTAFLISISLGADSTVRGWGKDEGKEDQIQAEKEEEEERKVPASVLHRSDQSF